MGSGYGAGAAARLGGGPRHPSQVALIGRLPCSFRGHFRGPGAQVVQCCVCADAAGPGSVSVSADDRGAARGGLLPDVAALPLASVHELVVAVVVNHFAAQQSPCLLPLYTCVRAASFQPLAARSPRSP